MGSLTIYNKQYNGFSLIEMAIVLLISGIMMGAGLSLLALKQNAAQVKATQTNQETIKQALINYLGTNNRLPCPATSIGGTEDRSSGSPCKQYSGIVPYATLGLDRPVALDGWENFIDYAVSPTPNASSPPYNAWLYTYGTSSSNTVTTIPNRAFWPTNTAGSLNVTGNSTLSGIVVALISHGKNGYGAFNTKGGINDSSAAGTDEKQNIPPISGNTVVKRDTTDSTAGGGAFDDVVMVLSANDLTGPLIANGTLQSNPQNALIQANNIVIGTILGGRNSTGWCGNYKFAMPSSGSIVFPTPDISYTNYLGSNIYACSSPSNSPAYTLVAGDGTKKTVSIAELQGIIIQGAGGFY